MSPAAAQALPLERRTSPAAPAVPAIHRGPYPIEVFLKILNAKRIAIVAPAHAHHTAGDIVKALKRADLIRDADVDALESCLLRAMTQEAVPQP